MKKELRKSLMNLIFELELMNIDNGRALTNKAIKEVFLMLQILTNEEVYSSIAEMWKNRCEDFEDKDSLVLGLMKFDREARFLLIEKKLI